MTVTNDIMTELDSAFEEAIKEKTHEIQNLTDEKTILVDKSQNLSKMLEKLQKETRLNLGIRLGYKLPYTLHWLMNPDWQDEEAIGMQKLIRLLPDDVLRPFYELQTMPTIFQKDALTKEICRAVTDNLKADSKYKKSFAHNPEAQVHILYHDQSRANFEVLNENGEVLFYKEYGIMNAFRGDIRFEILS